MKLLEFLTNVISSEKEIFNFRNYLQITQIMAAQNTISLLLKLWHKNPTKCLNNSKMKINKKELRGIRKKCWQMMVLTDSIFWTIKMEGQYFFCRRKRQGV